MYEVTTAPLTAEDKQVIQQEFRGLLQPTIVLEILLLIGSGIVAYFQLTAGLLLAGLGSLPMIYVLIKEKRKSETHGRTGRKKIISGVVEQMMVHTEGEQGGPMSRTRVTKEYYIILSGKRIKVEPFVLNEVKQGQTLKLHYTEDTMMLLGYETE